MSEENRALNALVGAIQAEIEANAFYTSLAQRVTRASARERLLTLAHDEQGHRSHLEKRYRKLTGGEPDLSRPRTRPSLLQVLHDHPLPERPGVMLIMETAMADEKDASEFYAREASMAPDEEGRSMFHQLSQMEEGHRSWLEAEYQKMTGGLYWFDVTAPGIMEE